MMRVLILLACIVAVANAVVGPQPTDCMSFSNCPISTGYGCPVLDVVAANPSLSSTFWAPWPGAGTFSVGEFYANDGGSNLMTATLGNVVQFTVAPGGQWYTDIGMLMLNLTLTSPPGVAVLTSYNFFLKQAVDPCGVTVWYAGGDVMVDFYWNSPNSYYNTPSQTVTFSQSNNMLNYWPCSGNGGHGSTVTDRLVNFTEWSQLPSAPLFGTGSQQYSVGATNAHTDYDAVVILWGSAGYNYGQNNYYSAATSGPHMGMDLAFGVQCTNKPPNPHVLPSCPGCAHAGADPACQTARADTNTRSCVSLSFDTPNNGCVFDNLM